MHKGIRTNNKREARWGICIEIPSFSEKKFFKKFGIKIQNPCQKYVINGNSPAPQCLLRKRKEYGYVLRIECYPESRLKIWKIRLVEQQVSDLLKELEKKKILYYDLLGNRYESGNI